MTVSGTATVGARSQRGFTLIELMTVVVILAVLAVVAVGAYTRYVRNAHKTEVVGDLSNLTLRQKTFLAKSGHYASSTDCEGAACTYPAATQIAIQKAPIRWDPADAGYSASGAADGAFFRGGAALHGFDALQFMPDGGDSWCGYATISGWGSTAGANADVPDDLGSTLITLEFPASTSGQFAGRDWFFSYALCDFDFDGVYWAFTTTHYSNNVNLSSDPSGTYLENE